MGVACDQHEIPATEHVHLLGKPDLGFHLSIIVVYFSFHNFLQGKTIINTIYFIILQLLEIGRKRGMIANEHNRIGSNSYEKVKNV